MDWQNSMVFGIIATYETIQISSKNKDEFGAVFQKKSRDCKSSPAF